MEEDDVINIFRLGQRGEDADATRPLLVQLASYTYKNYIMESLYRLRHAPQKFKGVVISHDLTRAERDARKIKVDEAQAMEQADTSGEYWYRVRGNPGQLRIVKIRKRN